VLSVRGKTTLIIIGVVLFITGSTLATGLLINNIRFTTAAEDTLVPIIRTAARLLYSETGRLKDEARYVAERVGMAGVNANEAMLRQMTQQPFLALSVANREGVAFHSGDPDTEPTACDLASGYARCALAGETVIAPTSCTLGGRLVIRIWTPVDGDRVLVATLPGLHLSKFTVPFTESPFFYVKETLFISVAIIIILGGIAAIFGANVIAAPYEKMKELKRVAEAASNSKTQFLANMSHEIRTPLNVIIGLSEMELANTRLRGDAFENIEKIYSAGATMLGIINDLLDISRIEAGKLMLTPVVYNVPNMINDTIQLNIVRLGEKPVQFNLSVNEDIPVKLKGDELKVKQIFSNLLSNAFKYTEAGSVEWGVRCEREGDRVKITSTIRDTGIGIHREDHGKLFKDYSQVNVKTNYYVEGTGLGLSITKKLVELMDGAITLESTYLKGSSFTVEFFQEVAGDEVIGKDTATNLSQFRYSAQRHLQNQKLTWANMSYATVLVVDDILSNLDIAAKMLKPYKINVDTAMSGREAIELVRAENVRYDAIFMDHVMPGLNGMQTVKAIRNEIDSEYAKNVPIVALTANVLTGNDSLYLDNGFQAFLSKPIDVLRLDQVLDQWVRNREKEKELPEELTQPVSEKKAGKIARFFKEHAIPGLNISVGLAFFQNDPNSYLSVLRSFIKYTPTKIDVIKNADSDLGAYRIAVHGLKGTSKGIGAEELGERAEKMEKAAAVGDLGFIRANGLAFIETAEKLVADIGVFIEKVSRNEPDAEKPEKDIPSAEALREILHACTHYDILGLRKAIEILAAYRYTSTPDLTQWITEQSHLSNFTAIQNRVALLLGAVALDGDAEHEYLSRR